MTRGTWIKIKERVYKILSIFVLIGMLGQIFVPFSAYAISQGPPQPEFTSFKPMGATEMVDLFSGDFSYNLPLMTVPGPNGGYPINLGYQAGVKMEDEASWVGLGWNINPGAINRQMRGLPDDFNGAISSTNGDKVIREMNIKNDVTLSVNIVPKAEFFGKKLKAVKSGQLSLSTNSYRGLSFNVSTSGGKSPSNVFDYNWDLGFDSQGGLNASFGVGLGKKVKLGTSFGFNTRTGIYNNGLSISTKYFGTQISAGSLALQAITPETAFKMKGYSASLGFSTGPAGGGTEANGEVEGSYSEEGIANSTEEIPAYGYIYLQDRNEVANDFALMDYNQGKGQIINRHTPFLSAPVSTHDIFTVTGQGIGGSFRAFRSDYGIYNQGKVESVIDGGGFGDIEFGKGAGTNAGAEVKLNHRETYEGRWESDEINVSNKFKEKGEVVSPIYEPYYFSQIGNMSASSDYELNKIGGEQPVNYELKRKMTGSTLRPWAKSTLVDNDKNTYPMANSEREYREKRGVVFRARTYQEYENRKDNLSLSEKNIYTINANPLTSTSQEYRDLNGPGKSHHIRAIEMVNSNGMEYTYGIPVYNTLQKDVTFSVEGIKVTDNASTDAIPHPSHSTGAINPKLPKVSTIPNISETVSISNKQGKDNFFQSTTIPAYASSFLLTEVKSPDYVDLTGDGMSSDDLGSYVKFNHSKHDDYKWRAPYNYNEAYFYPGNLSDLKDDRMSYSYGEKEIWYLNSIETKTHIALFILSSVDREDGLGAKGELSDGTPSVLKKLEKIELYLKGESMPIKTVHFSYSNELCNGVANNNSSSGKLTLKKIHFSYGTSTRGELSPYVFSYANNSDYDLSKVDIWGNYKGDVIDAGRTYGIDNNIFPFVDQSSAADNNAFVSNWNLSKIVFPSGSTLNIEYESDDYTHVQDEEALQMVKVVGTHKEFGNGASIIEDDVTVVGDEVYMIASDSYGEVSNYLNKDHLRVLFELPVPIPLSTPSKLKKEIIDDYVNSINGELYYSFLAKLKIPFGKTGKDETAYEYIKGYTDINLNPGKYGLVNVASGDHKYGYITLKTIDKFDFDLSISTQVNPIEKAIWQKIRWDLPELLYGKQEEGSNVLMLLKGFYSFIKEIETTIFGYYNFASIHQFGSEFDIKNSLIRLGVPDMDGSKGKKGGGHRVKQIYLDDQWLTNAAQNEDSRYGKVYEYVTEKGYSSGITSWEPNKGEDNPFRLPVKFNKSIRLKSDLSLFSEKPVGEQYYPASQVGYSRVLVKDYNDVNTPPGVGLHKSSTGTKEYKFYTSKDYPIYVKSTEPTKKIFNSIAITIPYIGTVDQNSQGYSQGHYIEMNDMHGKIKSIAEYSSPLPCPAQTITEFTSPELLVSKQKFDYKKLSKYSIINELDERGHRVNRVDSKVLVLDENGNQSMMNLGLQYDFVTQMHQSSDYSTFFSNSANVTVPLDAFPIPIPSWWPDKAIYRDNMLRTISSTKVVYKKSILEKVTTTFEDRNTVTENLVFDGLTGEPVYSSTTNNFDEPIYQTNDKAYMDYAGMGGKYKNEGAYWSNETITDGVTNISNASDYLSVGDELLFNKTEHYWVKSITASNDITLIDKDGELAVTESGAIELYKSSKANLLNVTDEQNVGLNNGMIYYNESTLEAAINQLLANMDLSQAEMYFNPSSPFGPTTNYRTLG